MNLQRSPVIHNVVALRRNRDYVYVRMLPKQKVTDERPRTRLIERNDHEMRHGFPHALRYLRFVCNLTNNFYVRLIGKGCEDNFSHEAGMVRHEDTNGLFHGTLRAVRVSMFQLSEVSTKKHSEGRTNHGGAQVRWALDMHQE